MAFLALKDGELSWQGALAKGGKLAGTTCQLGFGAIFIFCFGCQDCVCGF